jgi:restriction endonuclease S subunit
LKENSYCLKLEEKQQEIKKGWVKLGDICELLPKSKHKASETNEHWKYNFYTSSSVIKKSNKNNYIDEHLIIGSGGNGSLFIDKNFSCSADNFIIRITKANCKYIYYYLKINFNKLYELYKGGGLKHLSQSNLKDFQIPSLSLEHQESIVKFLDEEFELYNINQLTKVIKEIPLFDLLLDKNYDLFADTLHIIYRKMELDALQKQMEKDKKAIFNLRMKGLNCVEYKLWEIIEIKNLKSSKIEETYDNGIYPFYNCSILDHLWTNKYVYDEEILLIIVIK